jgi:hypothetical protein
MAAPSALHSPWHQPLPATPEAEAAQLFIRLVGVPPEISGPAFAEMTELVRKGRMEQAAAIATRDPWFYAVRVRGFATPFSNVDLSRAEPLNDLQALFIGIVRDQLDARALLTGDIRFQGYASTGLTRVSPSDNLHDSEFEDRDLDFIRDLERIDRQWDSGYEAAGALTTRAWAKAHYAAGTNRRAYKFAFEQFLCTPLDSLRNPAAPDTYVHRDVDRNPGGNASTYQTQCRACHATMDGMLGAFARMDFEGGRYTQAGLGQVVAKMNKNSDIYPDGHATLDDAWVNLAVNNPAVDLGWHGPTRGKGIFDLGRMLADSHAFSRCMIRKTYSSVCSADPLDTDPEWLETTAREFETQGRNLKWAFHRSAIAPSCGSLALKDFRELTAGMESILRVNRHDPALAPIYLSSVDRLPAQGRLGELTTPMVMALTEMSGSFCAKAVTKEAGMPSNARTLFPEIRFDDGMAQLSPHGRIELIQRLASKFWARAANAEELAVLTRSLEDWIRGRDADAAATPVILQELCTAYATSLGYLVK